MKKYDEKDWMKTLEDIRIKGKTDFQESETNLKELAESVDSAKLFVAVFSNLGFGPPELMTEAYYGSVPAKIELLAYYLYPHFREYQDSDISPFEVNYCMKLLDDLFRLKTQNRVFAEETEENSTVIDYIISDMRMKAEIIRGSAYPEQTFNEIISVQGKFEQWFHSKLGIGPKLAAETLWAIVNIQKDAFNYHIDEIRASGEEYAVLWLEAKKTPPKNRSDKEKLILRIAKSKRIASAFGFFSKLDQIAPTILPVDFDNILKSKLNISPQEWESLFQLMGLSKEKRALFDDPIEMRNLPLYVIPGERVIISDVSNALDVLWEKYERVAKKDTIFFNKRYQKAKSKWIEDQVYIHFSKVFPQDNIYRNLSYPDTEKDDGSTAEIDLIVEWGNFLLLVEVKASQFRWESQIGDIGRLRTDIKKNVEDAFFQARRAAEYISKYPKSEFTEKDSNRRVIINGDKYLRVYLITVSQHHLSGLATRLSMVQDLGLFKDSEYPFSISIADLEVVTQFCEGPDILLHYLDRRLTVQKERVEILAEELDFFGAYLDTRLQAERIWIQDQKEANGVSLGGFQDQFDKWYMWKRGDHDEAPEIRLKVPDEVNQIMEELRERGDQMI